MPAPWSQNAVSPSEQSPQAAESSSELEPATVVPAALVPEVERMLQASLPPFGVELSCLVQRWVRTLPWLTYLAAWACMQLLSPLLWCLKCACLWQGACSFSKDIGISSELFVLHVFIPASRNTHALTGFQFDYCGAREQARAACLSSPFLTTMVCSRSETPFSKSGYAHTSVTIASEITFFMSAKARGIAVVWPFRAYPCHPQPTQNPTD